MFSEAEQKAINEKVEQLRKIKDGTLKLGELADIITKRRVAWFRENKDAVLARYADLFDEEKAHRILFFDHMKINPEHSKITKVGKSKIKIESWSFCPYLEACKYLGLDTRIVCKEVNEKAFQKVCKMINPKLKFSRNYQKIRPHHRFCEEYFEIS